MESKRSIYLKAEISRLKSLRYFSMMLGQSELAKAYKEIINHKTKLLESEIAQIKSIQYKISNKVFVLG